MKTPTPPVPGLVRWYRLLLRCYPARHRSHYAGPMEQLFRDQLREARPAGRPVRIAALVLVLIPRTLIDFAVSCTLAHLEEYRRHRIMKRPPASILVAALAGVAVAALVFAAAATVTSLLPREYMGSVRIAATADTGAVDPTGSVDPFAMEQLRAEVTSSRVLEEVSRRAGLAAVWSPIYLGQRTEQPPLQPVEMAAILRDRVGVRRHRNTGMLEIRVIERDAGLAARIANCIAEVVVEAGHRDPASRSGRLLVVDLANPSARPIRPNVPLNLSLAGLVGLVLGALTSAVAWWMARLFRTRGSSQAL